MKLDLDLVRKILLDIEEKETESGYPGEPVIDGYSKVDVSYHVRIMDEGGLLKYTPYKGGYFISGLTWGGHEFLTQARSSKVWEKTKSIFIEKGIGLTIGFATEYMKKITRELLGLDI